MPATLRQVPFSALLATVWLAVAGGLLIENWSETGQTLLDTDDAMRLVQMKAWLAGQGWFDLHQPRLQPPLGYDPHWSRLVDAGLAGLLFAFRIVADGGLAERLMRAAWPLLWLLPTMAAMAAIAWRVAGREAALIALLLALVGVPAYQQFTPGRIDHHNVQIALAMLVAAATVWSDRKAWCAGAAGALTGLALAIGFEGLPYLAVCAAALSLRFVVDRSASTALSHYGFSLAASALVAFLVSVPPLHWTRGLCDAIAINSVASLVAGGGILCVAGMRPGGSTMSRAAAIALAGSIAAAMSLVIAPQCLRGPYAEVDPAIWPIWLADVRENQPLMSVIQKNPLTAAGIATFPAFAFLCALVLASSRERRSDFGFLTAAGVFAAAALTTIGVIRGFSYAMWLGMPLVAVFALQLFALLHLRSLPARFVAGLMLTPMALSAGAISIANAAGFDDTDSFTRPESRPCFRTAAYRPLAQLPPGLVVADVSIGPFLLALTPHAAMSAPYHRLSRGIVTAHEALSSPPEKAREILRGAKIDYVMVCGPRPPAGLSPERREYSLWGQLRAGAVPAWLVPVPLPRGEAFAVYRVAP